MRIAKHNAQARARKQTMPCVNHLTSAHAGVLHPWAPARLEGVMESRTEVAHYTETMIRELCRLCRKVELDDLAFLLEVAAAEAAKATGRNGSSRAGVHRLHAHSG